MKNRLPERHRDERGVALILTLAILVLVTLLVVAFAVSMRVESTASKTFSDQIKARQFAMAAVDEAVGKLRVATPKIGSSTSRIITNYVTTPGIIYALTNGLPFTVPLCSSGSVNDVWADINFGTRGLINRVNNVNYRMMVRWHDWVLVNMTPWTGKNNLIGRYCYWVDDEASKININAACGRPANPRYTPADIDLRAISTAIDTNNSYTYAQTPGYLSPDSWWLSGAITRPLSATNFFKITAYSQDTRLTPWGAPCFNLNTNSLTSNPLVYMRAITNMLENANLNLWFGPGHTFREKYGSNLVQIAANIKDYIDTDNACTDSGGNPPTYLGLELTPYLNELVISNSFKITTNGNWLVVDRKSTTFVELWYMYPPPAPAYDLTGHSITIQKRPPISSPDASFGNQPFVSPITLNASGVMTPKVWSGAYQVFGVDEASVVASTQQISVRINFDAGTVTAVFQGPLGRIDYASIRMTNHFFLVGKNRAGTTFSTNWISACKDPRVRPVSNYWNPVGGGSTFGKATLGGFNSGTVYYNVINTAPGATVQLICDRDFSCVTGMVTLVNRGALSSVGELGFIHTGVPWRTLALEQQDPTEMSNNLIPDWAVLDLFCTTNRPVAGRININSQIYISNKVHAVMSRQREIPLRALYYSSFGASSGRVASNIQFRIWNTQNSYQPPAAWLLSPDCYVMIGQICEVQGVTTNAGVKAYRERFIPAIANLITTRSNTFSIWAVGQAIVDVDKDGSYDPVSGDRIAGEVVVHAIVERYEDPAATAANRVKFRVKYLHYY